MAAREKTKRAAAMPLNEWIAAFERRIPRDPGFDWDRLGLQIGDPRKNIKKVAGALEATPESVGRAIDAKADLLVVHHPPLWNPVESVIESEPAGQLIAQCVRGNLAVYAAHTNWDLSDSSMTRHLGQRIGLENLERAMPEAQAAGIKIVVFVPEEHLEAVRGAMSHAGAGNIGHYRECSYSSPGQGTFLGQEEARPSVGRKGRLEKVSERRLEMIVTKNRLSQVIDAMKQAHPYEEAAYDMYQTQPFFEEAHLLWKGELPRPMSVPGFAKRIRSAIYCPNVRFTSSVRRQIRTVALCSGGGRSLIGRVASLGVDGFVTGDIDYHSARDAEWISLAVFDAGHYHTEKFFPGLLGRLVRSDKTLKKVGYMSITSEKDVFGYC